jgi:hypothetical protein
MSWFALGAAVVAAGVTYYNTEKTAERQDKSAAAGIRAQSQKQQSADARIAELVQKQSQSNSQDEQKGQMDAYLQTLQQGQQANGINQGVGGFSQQYRDDAATAEAGLQEFGTQRAGLLSRIEAPRLQRQNEGILFNDAATDIGMIGRDSRGQAFIDQLKLNAIKRDPWLDAFSSIAGGYASAGAGAGGA